MALPTVCMADFSSASISSEWNALDKLFTDADELHAARSGAPPASYGVDAPVAYKGPTPGSIGPPQKQRVAKPKPAPTKEAPKDKGAIWDENEVDGDVDEVDDGRPQPEYDIVYKQNVSPEDMFLGIDPIRHPGTGCSDEVVLKVQLPGTKLADIDLDVRPTFVRLQAPKYKLKVYMPERVDEQRGNAKWDGDKGLLSVTLPVVHEIDAKLATSVSDELD